MRASDLRGFGPVGTNGPRQYAERDLIALDRAGNHYSRHVSAMTTEELHSKSDIAAELAWRDQQIAELIARAESAEARVVELDAALERERQTTLSLCDRLAASEADARRLREVLRELADASRDFRQLRQERDYHRAAWRAADAALSQPSQPKGE